MYCQNCGEKRDENKNCQNCGIKHKGKHKFKIGFILFIVTLGTVYLLIQTDFLSPSEQVVSKSMNAEKMTKIQEKVIPSTQNKEMEKDKEIGLTEVIAHAQKTVYTIFAEENQGSGFLYNNNGAVVTNAHVVEGEIDVSIKTMNGEEFPGKVVGYSNQTDVAVIMVPDLAGTSPNDIEVNNESQIGEEVIALGSPLGLVNTATMGFITGKDRNFLIDNYTYENILQISAPIAPGSSGGPLISKSSEKIVAINSAKSSQENSIGFSIPIFKVVELIEEWLDNPMTEEDILAQFYDANGEYFFGGLWDYGEGYFDGGENSEDESYYNYWEYDYEGFEDEQGDSHYEDTYEETYDGYEADDWNEDEYYDEEYDQWDDNYIEDELEEEEQKDTDVTAEENELYIRIQEIELELEMLESELYEYPSHAEEYREILNQQIDLYEEMDELIEELIKLQ